MAGNLTAGTMSIRRQRAVQDAIGFLVVNEDKIVAGTEDTLFSFLEEGEIAPDVRMPLKLVVRKMQNGLDGVIRSDKVLIDARAANLRLRKALEKKAEKVRKQLVNIRGLVDSLYGEDRAKEIVAIDGPTAKTAQPELLWRQGEHTVERLEKETFEEPEKQTESVDFNPTALLEELRPAVLELATAHQAVVLGRKRVQSIVVDKDKVAKAFDKDFRADVNYAVGRCRVAGLEDLATKLNTALLQARGRSASGEEEEDPAPDSDDSNPDPSTADDDSAAGESTAS